MEVLHIRLLGEFSLVYGEQPVTAVNTARLQSLLAYLALHRAAPQQRQHVAFVLWPDSSESQARTNLRHLAHTLRQALPHADDFLRADSTTLQWRLDAPFTLDVADFESAVAHEAYVEAAGLYGGDLLPCCYDDWILPIREQLGQAYTEALERLVERLEDEREIRAAIGYARRLLQHDPLREETHRHLMRLHALNGDRAAALRVYHACATILQRELGVEPSPATCEVYQRLLSPDAAPAPPAAKALAATFPLVGRRAEWALLQEDWRSAAAGSPHLVLLSGEAGIGKTRLAEELLRWTDRQGFTTASAYCYAGEGALAYAPATAWLRARPLPTLDPLWLSEVARLLPEILVASPDVPPPGPLSEAWQRQRLFEALARAILGSCAGPAPTPLLLLIEDLQWCDRDTLEWLGYLLRFDAQARLLVVGTLRAEEVDASHPLTVLLTDLRRAGQLTEIALGPLSESETAALAEEVAGRPLERGQAERLYQETEGVPLFVVESLHAGLTAAALPPRVEAVLAARLAQLSPPARELADVAAVVGRAFRVDVLAQASGVGEEVLVRGLDEMWRRRIVREQGADAYYDFSHAKLRDVAYAGQSPIRRRVLHRRVAQALETVHTGDLDEVSQQIAAHYEQAGERETAVVWLRRAGEFASRTGSLVEAVACFKRALELLPPGDKRRAELTCQVGTLSDIPYGKEVAWEWLERAWALAQESGDPRSMALTRFGMSRIVSGRGEGEEALRLAEQALVWAKEINEQGLCASILSQLGSLARYHGEYDQSLQYLKESVAIFQALGDQYRVAGCLNTMGIVYTDKGDYEDAARCYRQGLELSKGCHDRLNIARIIQNLGGLAIVQGNYREAQQYAQEALGCFKEVGDHSGVALAYNNLGLAAIGLGDPGAAETCYLEALKEAQVIHYSLVALESLAGLAWVSAKRGDAIRAAELLGLAVGFANPDVEYTAAFVRPLLREALPNKVLEEALERGKRLDVYQVMVEILDRHRPPGRAEPNDA